MAQFSYTLLLCLVVNTWVSHRLIVHAAENIPALELQALYDLYTSTDGENWIFYTKVPDLPVQPPINLSNLDLGVPWNFSDNANPCADNWQGINCTYADVSGQPHISLVHLSTHNLVGTLPASLQDLTYLEVFSMPYNSINGTVPVSLCSLTSLIYLDVDTNLLTGTIPDCLGSLTNMEFLFLYKNSLNGTIPETLGALTALLHLGLNNNFLTGTIPPALGDLTVLKYLDLDTNDLTGTIPPGLGNLTFLLGLDAANNRLFGTIPDTVGNLQGLLGLYLSNNSLVGAIPSSVDRLHNLQYIVLDTNHLTGTIPNCVGDMLQLEYLGLNANLLTGTVPAEISEIPTLKILLLQNNNLGGNLNGVFNASNQLALQSVAINNNQLTGTLPGELFLLPELTSFVAVSNCFYGALPAEVCSSQRLSSLVLDGLSCAQACRNRILHGVAQSYTVSKTVKGKIPSCLFLLPNLTTLHLSGNGFTGQLSEELVLGNKLIDLSLSHNKLTGHIPTSIQERQWHNLDLSYNRIGGSLHDSFGTISLELPDVPVPDAQTPSPGSVMEGLRVSNNVQLVRSTTITPATTAAAIGSATTRVHAPVHSEVDPLGIYNYSDTSLSLENNCISGRIPHQILSIKDISILGSNVFSCEFGDSDLPSHDSGKSNYQCGSTAFDIPYYTWLSVFCVLVIVSVCIYVTEVGKRFFSIREWVENAEKWMSYSRSAESEVCDTTPLVQFTTKINVLGRVTFVCLVYVLMFLLPLFAALSVHYGTLQHGYAWTVSAAFLSGRTSVAWMLPLFICMLALLLVVFLRRISEIRAENAIVSRETVVEKPDPKAESSTLTNAAVYCTYILINTIVVVGVNVIYVYIAIYESNSVLPLAQVMLSLFKLYWNSAGTSSLLRVTVDILTFGSNANYGTSSSHGTSRGQKYSESHSLFLQVFVAQLNNIAIPCLVVGVVSPNCFYNMFVAAPDVDSSYYYEYCDLFSPAGKCLVYSPKLSSTSYSPPFTYSYQCSSSLITYYAPAFVLLCLVSSFGTPLLQLTLYHLHQRATPGTRWFSLLDTALPNILKPIPTESSEGTDRELISKSETTYFPANRVLLTLFTYLGVLLTFGAVFPPLAASLALTIFIVMVFARLKVGFFLHNAVTKERFTYVGKVMRECQGVGSSSVLISAMFMLITISCCFYTLFLFDTLGDAVGFHHSYWLLIVVPLQAVLFYALYRIYCALPASVLERLPWAIQAGNGESRETDLEMSPSGISAVN